MDHADQEGLDRNARIPCNGSGGVLIARVDGLHEPGKPAATREPGSLL
jgi:hypothetical protein